MHKKNMNNCLPVRVYLSDRGFAKSRETPVFIAEVRKYII